MKVSGPSGLLFAGNSSANLSCRAEAGEVVTSTWKKDGKALTSGGRVSIAADGMSVRLEPLQKEDNGQLVCELKNQVDSQTASYHMVVNCESQQHGRRGWRRGREQAANQELPAVSSASVRVLLRWSRRTQGDGPGGHRGQQQGDPHLLRPLGPTCQLHLEVQREPDLHHHLHLRHRQGHLQEHGDVRV